MVHKGGSLVLSRASKCRKAVMCLTEKTCMLDLTLSGMNNNAVGCEFEVKESMLY